MKTLLALSILLFTNLAISQMRMSDNPNSEEQFKQIYRFGKAQVIMGKAQNLSIFQMALNMVVQYSPGFDDSDPMSFNLATDGNHYLHGIPVYPITGKVLFSVQDQEAKLKQFWTVDGKEVTLGQKPFTAYLIESEVGFQQRQERIEIEIKKLNNPKYEKAIGPMIAIVNFDMQKQEIRFYQVTKDRKLIPSGSFNGSVKVPSTSYF